MTAVVHGPTAAVEGWSRVSGARPVDGGAAVPGGVRHRPQSVRDYVPGARARSPMIGGRPLDGPPRRPGSPTRATSTGCSEGAYGRTPTASWVPGLCRTSTVSTAGWSTTWAPMPSSSGPTSSSTRLPAVARHGDQALSRGCAGQDPVGAQRAGHGLGPVAGHPIGVRGEHANRTSHPSQRGRRSRGSSAPIPMGRPTTHDRSAEREPCSPTGRSTGSTRSRGSRHGSSVVHSAPATPHEGDDDTAGEASSSTTPRPCLGRSARGCADGAARPSRTGHASAPGS